jgi:hypothetical protein
MAALHCRGSVLLRSDMERHQPANGLRIEAHIENGRQHARHGLCRARAHRDEKGRTVAAETAAGCLLQPGDLIAQPLVECCEIFDRSVFDRSGCESSVGKTNAGGTFKPSRFICQISAPFDPASSGASSSSDWPAVPM